MRTNIDITDQGIKVIPFDEAMDDFSNANGSKRRNKKLARIKGRQQVAKAKHEAKDEKQQDRIARKSNRKTSRQDIRQNKKNVAQENRQGRKDYAQEERQTRKDTSKMRRVDRRNYGADEDSYENPEVTTDLEETTNDTIADQTGGSYEEDGTGGFNDSDEGSFDNNPDSDANVGSDNDADYSQDSPDYDNGEENGEFDSFIGAMETNEQDSEESLNPEDILELENLNPQLMTAAQNIEQHDERIDWLKDKQGEILKIKKDKYGSINTPCPTLDYKLSKMQEEIAKRQEIVSNLQGRIADYSNASGKNEKEALMAMARARIARLKHKGIKINPALHAQAYPNKIVVPARTFEETPINNEKSQNASGPDEEISLDNRYANCDACSSADGVEVVQEMSGANGGEMSEGQSYGTGEFAEGQSYGTGEFAEGQSYASGNKVNINWTLVLVSAGIAVASIYAIEKFNLFGNK